MRSSVPIWVQVIKGTVNDASKDGARLPGVALALSGARKEIATAQTMAKGDFELRTDKLRDPQKGLACNGRREKGV